MTESGYVELTPYPYKTGFQAVNMVGYYKELNDFLLQERDENDQPKYGFDVALQITISIAKFEGNLIYSPTSP